MWFEASSAARGHCCDSVYQVYQAALESGRQQKQLCGAARELRHEHIKCLISITLARNSPYVSCRDSVKEDLAILSANQFSSSRRSVELSVRATLRVQFFVHLW